MVGLFKIVVTITPANNAMSPQSELEAEHPTDAKREKHVY